MKTLVHLIIAMTLFGMAFISFAAALDVKFEPEHLPGHIAALGLGILCFLGGVESILQLVRSKERVK